MYRHGQDMNREAFEAEAKSRIVKTNASNYYNTLEERLAEQDKISFRAGINEVVGWLLMRVVDINHPIPVGDSVYARMREAMLQSEWQAKLKGWGLGSGKE